MTFAEKALRFHEQLQYTGGTLPAGIRVMNPYREYPVTLKIAGTFFHKYFNDTRKRHIILGINPGRFGGGLTGIPFTDPKRLVNECNIPFEGKITHEPSSVFIYETIQAYGGVAAFYRDFYMSSPCPLGFTAVTASGKETNYNYYDSKELGTATIPFMVESLHKLIGFGIHTDICFCLGTGKNEKFLNMLNKEHGFFNTIIALEHPRFIMQYRYASKAVYVDKFVKALRNVRAFV